MSAAAMSTGPVLGDSRATLRALIAVAAAVALGTAAAWWLQTARWPIHDVRIDGAVAHADRERLKEVLAGHVRAGFFRLDLGALRADLAQLPWVRDASLRRIWPDTLDVTIREHAVAARWNDDALLSPRGAVFEPAVPASGEAPALTGPDGHGPAMLERLQQFQARLAPLGLDIAALRQNARGDWRLELANGVALRLGRAEHVRARLARFVTIWPEVLAADVARIEAVDLRYTNGFAVAWRDDDAPASARGGGGA